MNPTTRHSEVGPEALSRRLYEDHGPALQRWAEGRFADAKVAEEVVQESVLAAWRKYEQFDTERGSERAWMFGITRNVAASRYRSDKRHLRVVSMGIAPDTDIDDAELAGITERSVITDAMRSLSNDHLAVVSAAYWDGLSTKEIASRLGIPDGTVKSRLHYALTALRAQLREREVLR